MKTIYHLLLAVVASAGLVSCSTDLLDEKPKSSYSPENAYVTLAQFNQAIKAFMAADGAVRGLNDHDSEVDTQIATAIDEHLRAIDRLCRFGIDGGFGEKHPVKEH